MSEPRLVRGISRPHLTALVVNCVVGSGILGLPSVIAGRVGDWALPVWALAAGIVGAVALCQSEVGSRFDTSGGAYLYARTAFGPTIGFATGWLSAVTRILAFASVCNLFASTVGGPRWVVVSGAVAAVTAVTWVGIRSTAAVSTALTAWKVVVLGGFVLAGAWAAPAWPAAPVDPLPAASDLGGALLAMMFAFAGFEAAAIPAAEARDPARDLPFALCVGLVGVAGIYGAVQHVCASALPALATADRPVVQAIEATYGAGAGRAFGVAVAVMLLGSLLSQLLGTSRLVFALAEHGELPRALAWVDPHTRAPTRAIAVTAAAAATATLASTFLTAVSVTVVTRVATWFVICAALPVLRRTGPAPFVLPAGPVVAGAAGLATLGLLATSAPREWAIAGALVLAGLGIRRASR